MTETAADQLARIVSLVAELTRRSEQGLPPTTLEAVGASFGVPGATIARDLRTLTLIGDHAEADWLLSLSVWQQEHQVSVTSAGPFRRPVTLAPDEALALTVALAMDPDGAVLAHKLAASTRAGAREQGGGEFKDTPDHYATLCAAVSRRRRVQVLYVGEGEASGRTWTIEPYQLVGWRGRSYVIAWALDVNDWRHFRLDRVLEATLMEERFEPRTDFDPVTRPGDLFRAAEQDVDRVRVRFAPRMSPWARERYDGCEVQADGSVVATLRASSPQWLVRRVLEYGADVEVIEPEAYREAVRRAVA